LEKKKLKFSVWHLWNDIFVHGTVVGIDICSRLPVYPCAQGLLWCCSTRISQCAIVWCSSIQSIV